MRLGNRRGLACCSAWQHTCLAVGFTACRRLVKPDTLRRHKFTVSTSSSACSCCMMIQQGRRPAWGRCAHVACQIAEAKCLLSGPILNACLVLYSITQSRLSQSTSPHGGSGTMVIKTGCGVTRHAHSAWGHKRLHTAGPSQPQTTGKEQGCGIALSERARTERLRVQPHPQDIACCIERLKVDKLRT